MVTEIWLLFKNLECRWWCDECMSVCVLFLPHRSRSLSQIQVLRIHFAFARDPRAGGVPGHAENTFPSGRGSSYIILNGRPLPRPPPENQNGPDESKASSSP